jgi:hypothetical protein
MCRIIVTFLLSIFTAGLLHAEYNGFHKLKVGGNLIRFEIISTQKNSQFSAAHPVTYQLIISNKSKHNQEGLLTYEVKYNDLDVLTKSFDVKIAEGGSLKSNILIPIEYAGNFDVNFNYALSFRSFNIYQIF